MIKNIFYIQELKEYEKNDELIKELGEELLQECFRKGICQEVKEGRYLTFHFVGSLIFKNSIVYFFPKNKRNITKSQMRLLLNVMKVYGKNNQYKLNSYDFFGREKDDFINNELYIADFIIRDYLEYGIYSKSIERITYNDSNEIYWDKTINELQPLIVNGNPYYLDTYHYAIDDNSANEISNIHRWAVNYCYEYYADMLGYNEDTIFLEFRELHNIGSLDYILQILKSELNTTYIDREVELLKSIIYLIEENILSSDKKVTLFGTKYFHAIWESVCSFVFENEYVQYESKIEKTKWQDIEGNFQYKDNLKPDILKTFEFENNKYFLVLDAKYYDFEFKNGKAINNPGSADVNKQLSYEKMFKNMTKTHKIINVFLFPNVSDDLFEHQGYASLGFHELEPIKLFGISDDEVYKRYINDEIFSEEGMLSFIQKIPF